MKYIKFCILGFACILFACKNGSASGQGSQNIQQDSTKTFSLPKVPLMLTTPGQRADFLVKHYWDNANFADTSLLIKKEISEQAWVDYCDLMNHVPLPTAREAIKNMLKRAEQNRRMYDYFTEQADKYLYDPNSPIRNEEFYIAALEAMTSSTLLNDTEKIRPQDRLKMAQKNRVGTKALNFTYTLASGATGNLYQCPTEYTVLFINNPGCHACTETIEGMRNSQVVNKLIADKRLKILGVYPDEELEEWHKHRSEFPDEWINGYDKAQTMKMKSLYDLKAIPTLYLLDKNKIVLLKDAPLPLIEQHLMQKANP